jgi:hypothetical protein
LEGRISEDRHRQSLVRDELEVSSLRVNAPVRGDHGHCRPRKRCWKLGSVVDNEAVGVKARPETLRNHGKGLVFGLARGRGDPRAKPAVADQPNRPCGAQPSERGRGRDRARSARELVIDRCSVGTVVRSHLPQRSQAPPAGPIISDQPLWCRTGWLCSRRCHMRTGNPMPSGRSARDEDVVRLSYRRLELAVSGRQAHQMSVRIESDLDDTQSIS